MAIVLTETGPTQVEAAQAEGDQLWLPASELERATGWSFQAEGFCRDDACIPVPPGREAEFVRAESVNVAEFWRRRGGPVLRSRAGDVWMLGESAETRGASLDSLEAPDFTLPDLDGTPHSLGAQRGKKVLLVTWASW